MIDPITTVSSKSSIIPDISNYANLYDFLKSHSITKQSDKVSTNTRIRDDNTSTKGGSYHISDIEYDTFLELFKRDILNKKKKEFFTEKQMDIGVCAIDLDFRYNYDIDEKQYDHNDIQNLICGYLDEVKRIYQLDDNSNFSIYLFEKPGVLRNKEKNFTKDGIHMLLCIQMDRVVQQIIRKRMMEKISSIWKNIPLINSWDEVFDEGITKGSVNWQLYGCRKNPNAEMYKLTGAYNISYDSTDGEFITNEIPLSKFDMDKNFQTLSVRYKHHLKLFMKNEFIQEYEGFKTEHNLSNNRSVSSSQPINRIEYDIQLSNIEWISKIRNKDELDHAVNAFLDNISNQIYEYDLKTVYDYVMILPDAYYGEGSYNKWIRVAWVLKNESDKLLIVWIAFSAKSPSFNYADIPELCDNWRSYHSSKESRLTKNSLYYWARQDALPSDVDRVQKSSIQYYIEQTISSTVPKFKATDYDLAKVLHQLFKHEYVCTSISQNIWFRFDGVCWKEDDSGISLKEKISVDLRDLYSQKNHTFSGSWTGDQTNLSDNVKDESESRKAKAFQILDIVKRCATTSEKAKLMTECKELFHDRTGNFEENLNENPYLLCFNNGVIDFETKTFRDTRPDDFISFCTKINYVPLKKCNKKIIKEITTFMEQLFPEKELLQYMWRHLASTLIGTTPNQTFNMYYGMGQNGKSLLVKLMEEVLGDYCQSPAPLSLITRERAGQGSATPELLQLKGKRYVALVEPTKKEELNEGAMKQLTSGLDRIQARGLYSKRPIEFKPQLKLILCCNILLKVNSNDHGTWRRIRSVPFKSLFTQTPVKTDPNKPYQYKIDPTLEHRLKDWKEIFMAMLVDIAFETDGYVDDCDIVLNSSKEYQNGQDNISSYVNERIVEDPDGTIKKRDLNADFNSWYSSTYSMKPPPAKEVHDYLDKLYKRSKNSSWKGIRISYDEDIEDDVLDNNNKNSDIQVEEL